MIMTFPLFCNLYFGNFILFFRNCVAKKRRGEATNDEKNETYSSANESA